MLYVIQNDPRVPAGVFGEILREMKIPIRFLHLYAGDVLPALTETSALIVLGGTMGVHDEADYPLLVSLKRLMRDAAETGIPLLGICLGGQLLASALGGQVLANSRGEKGLCEVTLTAADPLFAGLPPRFAAFEWHNDSFDVPPGAMHLAATLACPGQAFRWRNAWGLQFHPEVDRDIVAIWSAKFDSAGAVIAGFAAGEAAHRAMAGRLFGNFLAFAGI